MTQDLVDRFAQKFLIGKKCGFSLDDLTALIERAMLGGRWKG
jgi:hypothetical protein